MLLKVMPPNSWPTADLFIDLGCRCLQS